MGVAGFLFLLKKTKKKIVLNLYYHNNKHFVAQPILLVFLLIFLFFYFFLWFYIMNQRINNKYYKSGKMEKNSLKIENDVHTHTLWHGNSYFFFFLSFTHAIYICEYVMR